MGLKIRGDRPINISVDPGAGGTGIAIWCGCHWSEKLPPVMVGNLECTGEGEWVDRCSEICFGLGASLSNLGVREIGEAHLEFPEFYDSGKGYASANRGDLVKLAVMTGRVTEVLVSMFGAKPVYHPPWKWKGQLDKLLVQRRIETMFPDLKTISLIQGDWTDHVWDAIGIGLHAKGHF